MTRFFCWLSLLTTPSFAVVNLPRFIIETLPGGSQISSCPQLLARNEVVNSTFVHAQEYQHITWRGLDDITPILGNPFADYVRTLKNASIFIPGGGNAVYGLQWAKQGHKVLVVNNQDFYRDRMLPAVEDRDRLRRCLAGEFARTGRFSRIGLEPPALIERLQATLDLSPLKTLVKTERLISEEETEIVWTLAPGATVDDLTEESQRAFRRILGRVSELKTAGNFRLIPAAVERTDVWMKNQLEHSFDLYPDIFDSYTYSSSRTTLLAIALRLLKPNGMGFFVASVPDFVLLTKPESLRLFADLIKDRGEPVVLLTEYLCKTSPNIFSCYSTRAPQWDGNRMREDVPSNILSVRASQGAYEQTPLSQLVQNYVWRLRMTSTLEVPIVQYLEK